jgi:hypothetical protein
MLRRYTSGQGDSGTCLSACKDGSAKMLTTHKIKSWDYVNGEAAMMAALVNGPIAVAFAVYEDFFSYKTGVYVPNKASGLAGYHAVKMVGYGVTTGPKPQKCAPLPKKIPPHPPSQRAAQYCTQVLDRGQQLGPDLGRQGLLPDPERRRRVRHRVRTPRPRLPHRRRHLEHFPPLVLSPALQPPSEAARSK